ncbi:MAG: nucleoside deaminase [Planctomycetaceae bacterium]|nr:nucleoside deaminase [Planctomycetaceae bacterium]
MNKLKPDDSYYMSKAVEEVENALLACPEAIPIGAVLVIDGKVRSVGTNQRVQQSSIILHGETACLDNAGTGVTIEEFSRSTLYTTLSPCLMCAGTILRFNIPRVVIAENVNFEESELFLALKGVQVDVLNDEGCIVRMRQFIESYPEVWWGDITNDLRDGDKKRRTNGDRSTLPLTPDEAYKVCLALGFSKPERFPLPR